MRGPIFDAAPAHAGSMAKGRRRGTAQPDSQPDRLLAVPLRAPAGRGLQVVATLVVQGDVQTFGFRFAAHAQRHDAAGEPQ